MKRTSTPKNRTAVIGAGIAGLAAARTLQRAGHDVQVFDARPTPGGRMAHEETPFGGFDTGVQYFTVRDARFEAALATAPQALRRWSANAVRVLDEHGRVAEAARPGGESHWVAVPRMDALARAWAEPLAADGLMHLGQTVGRLQADPKGGWRLSGIAGRALVGAEQTFSKVVLALPAGAASRLIADSELGAAQALGKQWAAQLDQVDTAPCWVLLLAFAQSQLTHLGPHWNAAISTHHRVAWIARESSKPGRGALERWTVQASASWSREHAADAPARAQAKLERAFAELTGIRVTPQHSQAMLWGEAKTLQALGQTHLWSPEHGLGLCGDWCLGHRVEHAFVSGLELALAAR